MEDFIQQVVSQLGIGETTAKNATGTALGFLKDQLGDQFAGIADKLPGASGLIESASASVESEASGGGLLGSLTKAASSMLGGGAGQGMELISALQKTGLSTEQGGSFLTMLIQFVKQNVGSELLEQITSKVPALKAFLG